ncbi:MAG TPA: hypothetical protein VE753_03195 [Gaiellaceae bacterium]|jgi:hypothetical protein|nr:hypothetical protein [Gaiellaceae bacterium]
MNRIVVCVCTAAGGLVLAAGGLADSGRRPPTTFGPFVVANDDHGSCGNVWAVDSEKRTFKVKRNGDGSFRLWRFDNGIFITRAGRSPGACQKRRPHGRTVAAGKKGKFHGYLVGTVRGGTFSPNAVCPSDCGFTDVFVATFFGPDATFSCEGNSRDCAWDLEYSAAGQKLRFHLWTDKGSGAGTFFRERFAGDIASR